MKTGIRPLTLFVLVFVLLGVTAVGCGDQIATPTRSEDPASKNVPAPIYSLEDRLAYESFLEETWTTLFSTPWALGASGYLLTGEIASIGLYAGTNTAGDAFDLDAYDVTYYSGQDLIAMDTDGSITAAVQQYNLTMSAVSATVWTQQGSVDVDGIVKSYLEGRDMVHYFFPSDHAVGDPTILAPPQDPGDGDFQKAAYYGDDWDEIRVRFLKDIQSCRDDCEANSTYPDPADVKCQPGKVLDLECLEDARDAYHAAMAGAIADYCAAGCQAADKLKNDLAACKDSFVECEAAATAACLANPWGCVAHLVCAIKYRNCRKQKNADFDSTIAGLDADYAADWESAWDDLRTASIACCKKPQTEIGDVIELEPQTRGIR